MNYKGRLIEGTAVYGRFTKRMKLCGTIEKRINIRAEMLEQGQSLYV